MDASRRPVLATWLLEHVRFNSTDDALVGDLLEQFAQRPSAAWYWRQVLWTILIGFGNELRAHWVLAIRASAIGLAVSSVATVLIHFAIVALHQNAVIDVRALPRLVPWFLTSFASGAISGWLVVFLHPKHRAVILPTFAIALIAWASMGRGVIRFETDSPRFLTLLTDYVFVLAGAVVGFLASLRKSHGITLR